MIAWVVLFERFWRQYGTSGTIYVQGPGGFEFGLEVPADYATVPYQLGVDPATGLPEWQPGSVAAGTGLYPFPVTDGDPDDPQPLYVTNADGVPVFAIIWTEV